MASAQQPDFKQNNPVSPKPKGNKGGKKRSNLTKKINTCRSKCIADNSEQESQCNSSQESGKGERRSRSRSKSQCRRVAEPDDQNPDEDQRQTDDQSPPGSPAADIEREAEFDNPVDRIRADGVELGIRPSEDDFDSSGSEVSESDPSSSEEDSPSDGDMDPEVELVQAERKKHERLRKDLVYRWLVEDMVTERVRQDREERRGRERHRGGKKKKHKRHRESCLGTRTPLNNFDMGEVAPPRTNLVKSPSDTTLYTPALKQRHQYDNAINHISNFVESLRISSDRGRSSRWSSCRSRSLSRSRGPSRYHDRDRATPVSRHHRDRSPAITGRHGRSR